MTMHHSSRTNGQKNTVHLERYRVTFGILETNTENNNIVYMPCGNNSDLGVGLDLDLDIDLSRSSEVTPHVNH